MKGENTPPNCHVTGGLLSLVMIQQYFLNTGGRVASYVLALYRDGFQLSIYALSLEIKQWFTQLKDSLIGNQVCKSMQI